jgi:hypothetical protein
MNHPVPRLAVAGVLALCAAIAPAAAHDGDDHGNDAPAAGGSALPRFAASSETFELVGVLDGRRLTLYLDHAADNAPVADAALELEVGGNKLALEPHGPGEFEAELAEPLPDGVIAVTATVIAGNESDLLAAELDIHRDAAAAAPAGLDWKTIVPWAVAGLLALVAAALGLGRRRGHKAGQA